MVNTDIKGFFRYSLTNQYIAASKNSIVQQQQQHLIHDRFRANLAPCQVIKLSHNNTNAPLIKECIINKKSQNSKK